MLSAKVAVTELLGRARPRILFVHQSAELYGSDRVLLNLVVRLKERCVYDPVVVIPGHGPLEAHLHDAGIETFVGPVGKISRRTFSVGGAIGTIFEVLRSALWIARIARRLDVRIVHSNTIAVLGGAIASALLHVQHLWHVHELIVRPRSVASFLPKVVGALSDRVVCVSNDCKSWMLSENASLSAKTSVIWNGLARPSVQSNGAVASLRKRIGASPDDIVFAFVGRFNRWKGHLLFLEAFERLMKTPGPGARAVLVGGAPPGEPFHLETLRARIKSSNVRDLVMQLDFQENVWEVWDGCDVAVVPSLEPEPFGLVAIEAMAAGKPVIAARHGGLVDIVDDRRTGLLFTPRDVDSLIAAMDELRRSATARREMGAAARVRQQTLFSLESQVVAFEQCYAELLAS